MYFSDWIRSPERSDNMPRNMKSNVPSPRKIQEMLTRFFCSFSHLCVESWSKIVLLVVAKPCWEITYAPLTVGLKSTYFLNAERALSSVLSGLLSNKTEFFFLHLAWAKPLWMQEKVLLGYGFWCVLILLLSSVIQRITFKWMLWKAEQWETMLKQWFGSLDCSVKFRAQPWCNDEDAICNHSV